MVSLNKESYIEHFSQTNEKDADSSYIGYPEQEFVYLEVPPHLDVEMLQGMLVKIEE